MPREELPPVTLREAERLRLGLVLLALPPRFDGALRPPLLVLARPVLEALPRADCDFRALRSRPALTLLAREELREARWREDLLLDDTSDPPRDEPRARAPLAAPCRAEPVREALRRRPPTADSTSSAVWRLTSLLKLLFSPLAVVSW